MSATHFDEVDAIMAYEDNQLDREETIELFQHLVDTGEAWTLQGHYGREAMKLIHMGAVHLPKHKLH